MPEFNDVSASVREDLPAEPSDPSISPLEVTLVTLFSAVLAYFITCGPANRTAQRIFERRWPSWTHL
jgi:hypothetical protein